MSLDNEQGFEKKVGPQMSEVAMSSDADFYSIETLPRSPLQEKAVRGEKLTFDESIKFGRDKVLSGQVGEGISTRPDRAYRSVDLETLKKYYREGGIEVSAGGDEFVPGENNAGVDWYLGGFAPKYGDYILEAAARKSKFQILPPGMSSDPLVRHIKSKGGETGVVFSEIERIFKLERENSQDGQAEKILVKNYNVDDLVKAVTDERAAADQLRLADVRKSLGI
ncbi:MAG: hypothetical protein AAB511_02000 [Patescibacteria group bacterium]